MAKDKSTTKVCSIEGCGKRAVTRGWCDMHYSRWKRHGDPLKLRNFSNPEEAFEARTEWQGDCLVWTGAVTSSGYGNLTVNGGWESAHRYAWERVHGPIPEGLMIDHSCFQKRCVNVSHLRVATPSENASNQGKRSRDNTSGFRNVFWSRERNTWFVQIMKDKKPHRKFNFDTPEEASKYAEQLREELNGEFAGNG